jgi:hypothetical protein
MPSTAMITERLDALEASLPTIPSKVLHLQRAVAAKTYDGYAAAFTAAGESYQSFVGTAVTSTKTVAGQARAAGQQLVATLTTGVKTVAGQAAAQGRKVAGTASAEVTGLVDDAIDAVEDAVDDEPGSGTPYEDWTKAELVGRAKQLKIVGPTRMSKAELITRLRAA